MAAEFQIVSAYNGSKPPEFYYHLTTIDGIDLPHFAVFCFFRDRVTDY